MDKRFLAALVILISLIPVIAVSEDNNVTGTIGSTHDQVLDSIPVSGFTQDAIQNAIDNAQSGQTVFLPAGKYTITSHVTLKSGVSIQGESYNNTIIYGGSSAGGVSGSDSSEGWFNGNGVSSLEISNLQFQSSASGIGDGGHGETRNNILLKGCSNIKIHDCFVRPYQYNDFVKCHNGNNVIIYNCDGMCGHDFVEFLSGSRNCRVSNCNIKIAVNCAIRNDGTSNCQIDHCTITGVSGTGWCMCEVESGISNLVIDHNIFYDYHGSSGNAVVQNVHASGTVSTHDNIIWNCGGINMGSTASNTINPPIRDINYWVAHGYGAGDYVIINSGNSNNDDNNNDYSSNDNSTNDNTTNDNSTIDNSQNDNCTDNSESDSCDNGNVHIPTHDNICGDSKSNTSNEVCNDVYQNWEQLIRIRTNTAMSESVLEEEMFNTSVSYVVTAQSLVNGTHEDKQCASDLLNDSVATQNMANQLHEMKNANLDKARNNVLKELAKC